jgi:photosystem II stability/assembly factor-like uncharacterized protein
MNAKRVATGVLAVAMTLAAGAVAWAVQPAQGKGWRDVLDAPAIKSPLASRALLNGLASAGSRIVAVGQRGHILYSDDAGGSWRQADVPVSSDLVAVSFPEPTKGWAVGHDGVVLHSADAGVTWTVQLDGRNLGAQGAENPFLDVWFRDASEGFAVGAFGLAMHTTDGGAHWTPLQALDNPKSLHLYAVRGIGADIYISGEQGLMLKLESGDTRFRALELPYRGTLFGITGSTRSLVAFGLRGTVLRSTDGGRSWQQTATGLQVGLTAGTLQDDGRIVIVSQAGHILSSTDDGASFSIASTERTVPAAAVVAPVKGTLVIAGSRGAQSLPLP